MTELEVLTKEIHIRTGHRDRILTQLEVLESKQKKQTRVLELQEQALALIQQIAIETQEQLNYQVASIATEAFNAILDDPYEFSLIMDVKYGRTEACPVFIRNGEERCNPMQETGGGAVDIAAFGLRISLLLLSQRFRRVLVLDEPFRNLSKEYQKFAAELLETLAERLGIQIIMVTHESVLMDNIQNTVNLEKAAGG